MPPSTDAFRFMFNGEILHKVSTSCSRRLLERLQRLQLGLNLPFIKNFLFAPPLMEVVTVLISKPDVKVKRKV